MREEFKKIFKEIAKEKGYNHAFGGWFKESPECIAVLELQDSNFSNNMYLNIKIFIKFMFGREYEPSKDLVSKSLGHIMNQIRDKEALNLDNAMNSDVRRLEIEHMLSQVEPFIENALTKKGIREMERTGKIILLPAVREELDKDKA